MALTYIPDGWVKNMWLNFDPYPYEESTSSFEMAVDFDIDDVFSDVGHPTILTVPATVATYYPQQTLRQDRLDIWQPNHHCLFPRKLCKSAHSIRCNEYGIPATQYDSPA